MQVGKLGAVSAEAARQRALKKRFAVGVHAPNTHGDISYDALFRSFFHTLANDSCQIS
jgi:hypothetical protein